MADARIVIGVAYQAGIDADLKKGADGHRDYFTPEELEKAAATFLRKGAMQIGIQHADGSLGHADVLESFTWPSDEPWVVDGMVKARKGDWLIKAQLDEVSWALVKAGRLTGFSPQGSGKRVRRSTE